MTRAGDRVGVTPVVRAEIVGAAWRDRTRRTRLLQAMGKLSGDPEISADGTRAGELLGRLESRAHGPGIVDAMTAAVAERTNAVVVTDDAADFSRLRDEGGWRGRFRRF